MINTSMRYYNYFTLGDQNEYGQRSLPSADAAPAGTIKMAIDISSQTIQDNINYKDATYTGLTHNKVDDTYIIEFENKRLKVLYVNPRGRLNQVFMAEI